MIDLEAFVRRADAYAKQAGVKRTTVSKKLFQDGDTLDKLDAGWTGIQVSTLERGRQRLDRLERGLPPDEAAAEDEPAGVAA